MTTLVSLYLCLVALLLVGMMLWQYWHGTHDLLSLRNAVLVGFIIFHLTGAASDLVLGHMRHAFSLEDPDRISVIYAAMATVILILFLAAYHSGFLVKRFASNMPTTRAIPSTSGLWTIAVLVLVVGLVMRFVPLPLPKQILNTLAITFPVLSCGIVGWIWAKRFLNPFVVLPVLLVVCVAAVVVMTGTFGRRPLVAMSGALLWGMYYSHLRYLRPATVLPKLGVVALAGVIFLALFTSVRDSGQKDRTGVEYVRAIQRGGDIKEGLRQMISGQSAGQNSMWLIEQYPMFGQHRFETRPFFTLHYFIVLPIPRAIWEGKPAPLSQQLPTMAAVPNVNRNRLTLGPGIIGHAAAEGGWIALIVYGLLAGLLFRFFDEIVQVNAWSPLVVLAIGSTLGHVVGAPRGETAVMTMLFVVGSTMTYFVMLGLGKLLEMLYGASMMEDRQGQVFEQGEWIDESADWGPQLATET